MTRCLPLCGRTRPRGVKKGKRVVTLRKRKLSDGQLMTRKIGEEKRKLKRTTGKLRSWFQGNF